MAAPSDSFNCRRWKFQSLKHTIPKKVLLRTNTRSRARSTLDQMPSNMNRAKCRDGTASRWSLWSRCDSLAAPNEFFGRQQWKFQSLTHTLFTQRNHDYTETHYQGCVIVNKFRCTSSRILLAKKNTTCFSNFISKNPGKPKWSVALTVKYLSHIVVSQHIRDHIVLHPLLAAVNQVLVLVVRLASRIRYTQKCPVVLRVHFSHAYLFLLLPVVFQVNEEQKNIRKKLPQCLYRADLQFSKYHYFKTTGKYLVSENEESTITFKYLSHVVVSQLIRDHLVLDPLLAAADEVLVLLEHALRRETLPNGETLASTIGGGGSDELKYPLHANQNRHVLSLFSSKTSICPLQHMYIIVCLKKTVAWTCTSSRGSPKWRGTDVDNPWRRWRQTRIPAARQSKQIYDQFTRFLTKVLDNIKTNTPFEETSLFYFCCIFAQGSPKLQDNCVSKPWPRWQRTRIPTTRQSKPTYDQSTV